MTNEALATTTQYLYDGLNPVALTAGTSATTLLTGLNIDEYFSFANSTGSASLMTDVLGSIIALTDSTGAVYENYYYEPFGGSPPLIGAPSASAPLITIPFGFTGREDDDGTVYYYRARYYNTYLRRFISQDPLDFAGGDTNLYAYVLNNPTNETDPTGLCGNVACIGTALIIAGNPKTIDATGGFSGKTMGPIKVYAGSAAVHPSQWWGGVPVLISMLPQIRGSTFAGPAFNGVSDTIGGTPPSGWQFGGTARDYFHYMYPDDVLIELPSLPKQTPFETPIVITVPIGYPCPTGTVRLE